MAFYHTRKGSGAFNRPYSLRYGKKFPDPTRISGGPIFQAMIPDRRWAKKLSRLSNASTGGSKSTQPGSGAVAAANPGNIGLGRDHANCMEPKSCFIWVQFRVTRPGAEPLLIPQGLNNVTWRVAVL